MDIRKWIAVIGLSAIAVVSAPAYAQQGRACSYDTGSPDGLPDIRYLTGGVGADQAAAFRPQRSHYAPAVTLSELAGGRGYFVAYAQLSARDAQSSEVFCIAEAGPYVFIDLPPGRYQLTAVTADGRQQQKTVTLLAGKHQDVALSWPALPQQYPSVQSPAALVLTSEGCRMRVAPQMAPGAIEMSVPAGTLLPTEQSPDRAASTAPPACAPAVPAGLPR